MTLRLLVRLVQHSSSTYIVAKGELGDRCFKMELTRSVAILKDGLDRRRYILTGI